MSTPGNEFRQTEYLGIGFLAISSKEIIERLLEGKSIDEDDRYILQRAEVFLNDVSSGAQLVTSGISSNVSAVDTVRKLAYSVEPLKLMQDEFKSAEVGELFEKMAEAINLALNSTVIEEVNSCLTLTKDFFNQLHLFLVNLVEIDQQRIGKNSGLYRPLLAYA